MVRDDLRPDDPDHQTAAHSPADEQAAASPLQGDVTLILSAIEQGDGQAAEKAAAAGV